MAKRSTLGAAGAHVLRGRTGGDALAAVVTTPTPATPKSRRTIPGTRVTTFRITDPQWAWLRAQATRRSLESGTAADASEIMRELVAAAMAKDTGKR